ncbi:dirigent protein 2-like [Abrus precatorius]|uniref:Dirigent protein n=1 Tax=Abrus precatorius TaxID=3816 RepID=A0A8B8KWE8_ABRPR|nr:dirigent protein 2-like [Abrus precatorius]
MVPSIQSPTKFMSLSMLLISIIMMVCEVNGQLLPPSQRTIVLYLQDIAQGPNATVAPVIGLRGKDWSFNTFGTIFVVGDPLTLNPSPSSTTVGWAQGLLVATAHDGANVNVVLSIVFNNLEFKGSSLQLQGISNQRENDKEVSVVSGTGMFRFARGFASFHTIIYDPDLAHSVIRLTINLRQTIEN